MDTLVAMHLAEKAHKEGQIGKVFDWHKAAQIIKDEKVKIARAGLKNDWEYTGGTIFENGRPIEAGKSYTYLSSIWATPELEIVDEDDWSKKIACYIENDNNPENWDADTFWPESALEILRS